MALWITDIGKLELFPDSISPRAAQIQKKKEIHTPIEKTQAEKSQHEEVRSNPKDKV